MSNIAIKVENLGKKIMTPLNPFYKGSSNQGETVEEFWALKDINFETRKGDKAGITGRTIITFQQKEL